MLGWVPRYMFLMINTSLSQKCLFSEQPYCMNLFLPKLPIHVQQVSELFVVSHIMDNHFSFCGAKPNLVYIVYSLPECLILPVSKEMVILSSNEYLWYH